MAKMTIRGTDELELQLSKLGKMTTEIAKDVVMAGAQPVADEIRADLRSLPVDKPRYLESGDEYNVVTKFQLKDLDDSLGITPPDVDRFGNVNTKVGFDGYGSYPTEQYPKGLPNQLLARAIESGSSVRKKNPFIRKAVNRSKKKSLEEMQKKFDEEIELIIE
jgi:HK97 gp10 family phage protein